MRKLFKDRKREIENMDVTVLVNSCDSYEDTWRPFFILFKKYWKDCPYDIVLNTESKIFSMEGVKINCFQLYEKSQKIAYGKRMLDHLKQIRSKYIFLLMDDFFIRRPVKTERIEQCLQWMKENPEIAVFSFENVKDELNIKDNMFKGFELRPQFGEYKLNLQAALWRKSALIKYTKKHENPWQFEIIGSQRTFWTKDKFYVFQDISERIIDYGKTKHLDWGIVRGKWMIDDVEPLFKEHDIHIDYFERGVLKKEDIETVRGRVPLNQSLWNQIRSYGLFRWCTMNAWRGKRAIMKNLGLEVPNDYIEYLRNKNGGGIDNEFGLYSFCMQF